MNIRRYNTALVSARCVCLFVSALFLNEVSGSRCLAQENAPAGTHATIKSWLIEPGMTLEDEANIRQWIESSPKATKPISTINEFVSELRAAVPTERPFDITVNLPSLEELGFEPDEPFFDNNLDVGTSLLPSLQPYDLTYQVRDGVFEITSQNAAEANPCRRIYDVTCLLSINDENGNRTVNFGDLIGTIHSAIQPDQWDVLGGSSTALPLIVNKRCLLVVCTPSEMHRSLQTLLDGLAIAGNVTANDLTDSASSLTLRNDWTSRPVALEKLQPGDTSKVGAITVRPVNAANDNN